MVDVSRLLISVGHIFRYYGGWAAPNIYFLGFAGVVKFGNIRIGGLSGIYNQRHYHLGWLIIIFSITKSTKYLLSRHSYAHLSITMWV